MTPETRARALRWARNSVVGLLLIAVGAGAGYYLFPRTPAAKITPVIDPAVAPCAFCAEASPESAKPLVAEAARLAVDANGASSGIVTVCNTGSAGVDLDLVLDDFYGFARDGSRYSIGTERGLTIDGKNASESKSLAANQCVKVKVDVTRLWQAGLMTATLRSGKTELALLKATRTQVPFGVRIDGETPDKVNVSFTRGHVSRIWLRNDDAMTYRFRWRLEIGDFAETGQDWIEPNRRVGLPVELDCDQYSFLESGFLRSGAKSGNLFIEFEPDPSMNVLGTPSKQFKVEARLNYWEETAQRIWNYVLILLVLVGGILLSLAINHALPIQNKRVAAKQRLVDLEGRLAGLGDVVDSQTLSLVRVEKKRLREALRELWPIFPSTETLLPKLEERIGWLEKRIELTVKAGEHLSAIVDATDLGPDEEDEIRELCRAVLGIVEKSSPTPEETASAFQQLDRALAVRESASAPPTPEMAASLRTRQDRIPAVLGPRLVAEEFRQSYDELLGALRKDFLPAATDAPRRADYFRAARAVRKGELLLRFVDLLAASGSKDVLEHRKGRSKDLLAALLPGAGESLQRADEVVRETEQNIDRKDVVDAIKGKGASLKLDPPTPFPYQLVQLRVHLGEPDKPGFETAVARREITCEWRVGETPQEETSWTIGTYFENEGAGATWGKWLRLDFTPKTARKVAIEVKLKDGKEVLDTLQGEIKVEELKSYVESRTLLAIATLGITVTIVGIGLLAGALEKLQTLDWVAGFFAIVALGFGADVLKKLIAKS